MKPLTILLSAIGVMALSGCDSGLETSATETSANLNTSDASTDAMTSVVAPGENAPILALQGSYAVGVTTITLTNPDQPDITNFNYLKNETSFYDREISVDILYPATASANSPRAQYTGQFFNSDEDPIEDLPETFTIHGEAFRDASPITGETFPLVIVSHGLSNTPGVLANLTENIASKGYVVAAIDHGDYILGEPKAPIRLFQRILLFRSIDQQFVLRELTDTAEGREFEWAQSIDASNVALLGFSMGGYGVLNHAGAGYDSGSATFGMVAGQNLSVLAEGNENFSSQSPEAVKAVIAMSPWGAQSSVEMWDDTAFANITAPLLLIVGDQDDIVGFEDGVKDVFHNTTSTDRYLLVFQNAMHNLVQVAAPPIARSDIRLWEAFEDPVWQREKIHSINRHFITAFLDLHLKGMDERRAFLDVPTVAANDGDWPQPMGKNYSTQFADGTNGSEGYWPGFKRRQALGLEMHYLPRGEGAPE